MMNQATNLQTADSAWKSLYEVGGVAALSMLVLMIIQIIIFIAWPPPSTVDGYFTLFQKNWLLGLLSLDLLYILNNVLLVLIYLALYTALKRVNESFTAIALTLGLVGIAAYFASNTAFEMFSLSNQYAAATTDAERAIFLGAGQALLAINNPGATYQGTGIYLSLLLVTLAGLIISIVMLQSSVFGKATASMGILANAFGLGYFIALAFAPEIVFLPLSVSAPFLLIWYVLIGLRLFHLGRLEKKTLTKQP